MYLPKQFSATEHAALELIDQHPFATLITLDETGEPFANHVPLLLQKPTAGAPTLLGHFAKRNPQLNHFADRPALAIFHGPHAYITPSWYSSGREVPTWNYAVVQVRGRVRSFEDSQGLTEVLQQLTKRFEAKDGGWKFGLPEDLARPPNLSAAITGFEITLEKIEAKFKLSQNRRAADQQGVLEGLKGRGDEMSLEMRQLMMANLNF